MTPNAPTPLYKPDRIDPPAYHLRYTWTGWPSIGYFPIQPPKEFFSSLQRLWETDGIRVLEFSWSENQIQFTCSVQPTVSPILFSSRIKGRLQHSLRISGTPASFSRKVAFRSIGENKRQQVESYIASQVANERFVDDRFAEYMQCFTLANTNVRLQYPSLTNSGRYWYNLHLVLVTDSRMKLYDKDSLSLIADTCDKVSVKKSYGLSRRSVMPDHVHMALRGDISQSPQDIALSFMNNIAFAFGQKAIFRPSYYVGTFGEYDMGAVR